MQRPTHVRWCSRFGMSRVEAVVTIGLIGFLITMLVPAVQSLRGPSRRMECQNNLKQIALAVIGYASANGGHIPLLDDGQFGWPVPLLPYLDQAALHRALQEDPLLVETESRALGTPLQIHIKVLTCPVDPSKTGKHVGLSYVANAGWGRFLADAKTEAVSESRPHSVDVDWDRDGNVTEDERLLTRATGLFWRAHEDGFQLTLDNVADGDGQTNTMLFTENTNARNWLSRETFDIGFVVELDRITFEPSQDGRAGLNVKSANLGSFAIQPKPRVQPGRSPVPSSQHTGYFNVAFADGRVEHVNVNIAPRVYLASMTWNGGRHGEDPKRHYDP